MRMEIWKDILGYEGLYRVSSSGEIKSLKREIIRKNKVGNLVAYLYQDVIKRPHLNKKTGYLYCQLSKNDNAITYMVHRIVAQHFADNPENKPQVNHINGVKTDNRAENLEWVTISENAIHAFRMGLRKPTNATIKRRNAA